MTPRPPRLPIVLDIPAPCSERWSHMTGGDRVRECARCKTPIHNLSALTEREIAELVVGERVCVRLEFEADGTLVSADSRVPGRPRAGLVAVAAALTAFSACGPGQAVGTTAFTSEPPAPSTASAAPTAPASRSPIASPTASAAPVSSAPSAVPSPTASAAREAPSAPVPQAPGAPVSRPRTTKVGMVHLAHPK